MTRPRLGSLFSGYGGLDLAVEEVFDAQTVWVSDIDSGACKILAHRFPDAPNLGDITTVDWTQVPPVDIIAGGSPCQDISSAGRMAGMRPGTRSNLWVEMRQAIATLRPALVIWENVRAAASTAAHSDLESCPGCMGGAGHRGPDLRALGRVLGDLAELGYDAQWYGLRAADVGACHGRFRFFVLAADANRAGLGEQRWTVAASSQLAAAQHAGDAAAEGLALLPTPVAHPSGNSPEGHLGKKPGREVVTDLRIVIENGLLGTGGRLLPTPRTSDTNGAGAHGTGGPDLRTVVDRLLPTPTTEPMTGNGHARNLGAEVVRFGQYAAAVQRHADALGRPAPSPTEPGAKGNPRLSGRFTEWMMGAPDGWICDVPGITRNEVLKACGNGVYTPQAAYALRVMAGRFAQFWKDAA